MNGFAATALALSAAVLWPMMKIVTMEMAGTLRISSHGGDWHRDYLPELHGELVRCRVLSFGRL
jgi:hypothetical protein